MAITSKRLTLVVGMNQGDPVHYEHYEDSWMNKTQDGGPQRPRQLLGHARPKHGARMLRLDSNRHLPLDFDLIFVNVLRLRPPLPLRPNEDWHSRMTMLGPSDPVHVVHVGVVRQAHDVQNN